MLNPDHWQKCTLPKSLKPQLTVIVDTEEEFDWSKPQNREETAVSSVSAQIKAHDIYEKYALQPVYVIDYPVASQRDGYAPLKELFDDKKCFIGSHLHPWVNPPHEEKVTARNTYPGNLPAPLEREKLKILTEIIQDNFDFQPRIYRAGRSGIGPHSAEIIEDLGYLIDTSVVPKSRFIEDGGPDFSHISIDPFWFGRQKSLLELPSSVGYCGLLAPLGTPLHKSLNIKPLFSLRMPGIFARTGLFERIRLSPEGLSFDELCRLTKALLKRGNRLFSLTYHSPSLAPGNTPYVRNQADLDAFLQKIDRFLAFFIHEMGGEPSTPDKIYTLLEAQRNADIP